MSEKKNILMVLNDKMQQKHLDLDLKKARSKRTRRRYKESNFLSPEDKSLELCFSDCAKLAKVLREFYTD